MFKLNHMLPKSPKYDLLYKYSRYINTGIRPIHGISKHPELRYHSHNRNGNSWLIASIVNLLL